MDRSSKAQSSNDSALREAARILVVDDDPGVQELIGSYLTQSGYRISVAADGQALRRVLVEQSVDLVILDLGLPGEDGLSLTRYLREHSTAAIIIVTGRGETVDRIIGLEIGADDYMAKPFDLRELLARVRSVLRRAHQTTSQSMEVARRRVCFAGWQLDLASRQLLSPDRTEVPLTTGEFDLLAAFAKHPNRVLTRDELLALTHHREAAPFDRSIDVQVGRLRRKIEVDPENPVLIRSVRAAGYIFTPSVNWAYN